MLGALVKIHFTTQLVIFISSKKNCLAINQDNKYQNLDLWLSNFYLEFYGKLSLDFYKLPRHSRPLRNTELLICKLHLPLDLFQ